MSKTNTKGKKISLGLKMRDGRGNRGQGAARTTLTRLTRAMRHRLRKLVSRRFVGNQAVSARRLRLSLSRKSFPKSKLKIQIPLDSERDKLSAICYWGQLSSRDIRKALLKSCSKLDKRAFIQFNYAKLTAHSFRPAHLHDFDLVVDNQGLDTIEVDPVATIEAPTPATKPSEKEGESEIIWSDTSKQYDFYLPAGVSKAMIEQMHLRVQRTVDRILAPIQGNIQGKLPSSEQYPKMDAKRLKQTRIEDFFKPHPKFAKKTSQQPRTILGQSRTINT